MVSSAAKLTAAGLAERIARRDKAVVLASVGVLVVLAWAWLAMGAGMSMPASFATVTAMWMVMMVAMMLPSASPAILLYARVKRGRSDAAVAPTWCFTAGYLIAWLGYALAVAAVQVALVHSGWLEAMALKVTLPGAAGAMLIAAGAYQLSPWKNACLSECRSPAAFISRHWRPGVGGAVRLGLLHGAVCVGCCWLLMILLFAGGVMNLAWVAALAALVAVEKILPLGAVIARAAGIALLIGGAAIIVA